VKIQNEKINHEFEPMKRILRKKLKNKTKSGKKKNEDFFFLNSKQKKFFLIKTKQTTKNPILYVLLL